MRRWLAGMMGVALLWLAAASASAAVCQGRDLLAAMPPAQRAALEAEAARVPYARGLLWEARRGEARIVLAGTYHFADPRHEPLVRRLRPEIAAAATLLVEAGPKEAATLTAALRDDPTLMVDPAGPTLAERLPPDEWAALSDALSARGLPGLMASRLRPWYVATMLSLSPCMVEQAEAEGDQAGLDHLLMEVAREVGTPVRALERWDTLFSIFEGLTEAEEIDMVRGALSAARHADDYATTMLNAYFAGNVQLIWAFTRADALAAGTLAPAEIEAQMRLTQERLIDRRNAAWMKPLVEAAAEARGRSVVAAFGALHLPGRSGVLALLEADGWEVRPLP